MTTEYIVIKIGGVASKQLTPDILAKLSEWQQAGQKNNHRPWGWLCYQSTHGGT